MVKTDDKPIKRLSVQKVISEKHTFQEFFFQYEQAFSID